MFHLYVDAHCPALSFSALSVKAIVSQKSIPGFMEESSKRTMEQCKKSVYGTVEQEQYRKKGAGHKKYHELKVV
jgi:hypothetical protein